MRARLTARGSQTFGYLPDTLIEFETVNQYGCAVLARIVGKPEIIYNVSIFPHSSYGDEMAVEVINEVESEK